MPTHTGSGFSECTDSFQAGAKAAAAALAQAGVSACALAILMTTSRHNPHQFLAGVRAVLGPQTQVLGSYAVGVITNTCLGYDGYQCGVAVLASDTIQVNLFLEEHLANNEYACGHALAQQVLGQAYDGPPNLLFFYDSVNRTTGRFRMNMGTPLLAGMSDAWGASGRPPPEPAPWATCSFGSRFSGLMTASSAVQPRPWCFRAVE
ncbi:FIST N-terminal domain-containing protein [Hymenobacter sp. AT01-02]|uniref:FIST N-terminal domain-containing protein n=1 Tax=Hymenobacter sp. AT01-02 TaxID=1571877 RepID=UPI0006E1CDD3|nr:FIST N-terminal domain-containing protein [Hymenobacter sp. AT01-02]